MAKADIILRGNGGDIEECWEWGGPFHKVKGHGMVRYQGKNTYAHRVAYLAHCGDIPDDRVVDHRCQNPRCWNPNHLRLLTNQQNVQYRKGLNKNNASGFRGVHWSKQAGKWIGETKLNRRKIYCGAFETPEEAHLAVSAKRKELGFIDC